VEQWIKIEKVLYWNRNIYFALCSTAKDWHWAKTGKKGREKEKKYEKIEKAGMEENQK
jgi:hypothetical protein